MRIKLTSYGRLSNEVNSLVKFDIPVAMCEAGTVPQSWQKVIGECLCKAKLTIDGKLFCKKHAGQFLIERIIAGEIYVKKVRTGKRKEAASKDAEKARLLTRAKRQKEIYRKRNLV